MRRIVSVICVFLVLLLPGRAKPGIDKQGLQIQGLQIQGLQIQGLQIQGLQIQGLQIQGTDLQGLQIQGLQIQGLQIQGLQIQGLQIQGVDRQGLQIQGLQIQGLQIQGTQFQGLQIQGLQIQGTSVQSTTLQGFQTAGIQLQDSSTALSSNDGSFIFVPSAEDPTKSMDLRNTFWQIPLADPQGKAAGHVLLYIADVQRDTTTNSSKYPDNSDVYLYTVYFWSPNTGGWSSLCPEDKYGNPHAIAIPVDPTDRGATSRKNITFACTASGVGAKCARSWGYKPWKTVTENLSTGTASIPLAPFYNSCLIAARAAYCQDGQSYTQNGTTVDLFDTLDGVKSINYTVGTPFEPYSTGIMLHDEYQISALDIGSSSSSPYNVSDNYTHDELMSLPADTQTLVESLQRSGMESSRYATLDPGRSCPAMPYIDRCTPVEPYDCYRSANLSAQPYGAFLAVNSPRHCSHDEDHPGEALDPLCNECVNRVCQVDPTCCGDPGQSFYPGSLVWDSRCSQIRQEVCKSSTDAAATVWPDGVTAVPASSHTTTNLSGALGSFEGISSSAGAQFVEGWACDPDFPGVGSPVQISVGGELGASGAALLTTTANLPLALASWQSAVASACGGPGNHGFRLQLPANSAGKDVYVYGIDLNVPGSPFTLLRGGHKTVPNATAASSPQAASWSGWLEPPMSGQYQFYVTAGSQDLYRVWVNGVYVAGNWTDPDPTAPGAFELTPPNPLAPPFVDLQVGIPYAVSVQYLRPTSLPADSQFQLGWNFNTGYFGFENQGPVPAGSFYSTYPVRDPSANISGITGDFFDQNGAFMGPETQGAVDAVWTNDSPPVPGLSVSGPFSAYFQGQVVPPVSGDYTFSAATDGAVQITINNQMVTNVTNRPTGFSVETCGHDICSTGAAVSRTCPEGFFCSGLICDKDPSCCSITWDSHCVQEVAQVCQLNCAPASSSAVTLAGGSKNDITVTYNHQAGGAELHLMWSLSGSTSSVIPASELVSSGSADPPGNGINAAYFSDTAFTNEYLDHVEPTPSFQASTVPDPTLATSMICQSATCGAGGPPGALTLISAAMGTMTAGKVPVTVTAAGATSGTTTTFTISDGGSPITASAISPITGGTFTFTANLAPGPHTLTIAETVGGQTGPTSAPLTITAADVAAPPSPTVTVPPGGFLSGNGQVQIGGTATPNAAVTVTAGGTTTTFSADASGNWSGLFTLPTSAPGTYALSITQTVGGVTSVIGTTTNVNVALPALTVTSPTDGTTVSNPLTISGSGADPSLGDVIVGDGDGTYFAPRGTITVNANGTFSGPAPTLDYGQHKLKIFQSANGLDGTGVVLTVSVAPPAQSLAISSPTNNSVVGPSIVVQGTGGLPRTGTAGTGMAGQINIYQNSVKVGHGPRNDDGSFTIPVTLTGAGPVTLTVTQTASSLSGGGVVESGSSAGVTVIVQPGAPAISLPVTGTIQTLLDVAIAGTAVPGATVHILVDRTPTTEVGADATGEFSTTLTLANGSHALTATQTVPDSDATPNATSNPSQPTIVIVGDVTPPLLTSDTTQIVATAPDFTGVTVDVASHVTAKDNGVAMPAVDVTCAPASGSLFPVGITAVTCQATDTAGNVGSTWFTVKVVPPGGPTITGSNLVAEAQGPAGAPVSYQITATGAVPNCAPTGSGTFQACNHWQPAYSGLGFLPTAVAGDPNDGLEGALYAGFVAPASYTDPNSGCTQTLVKSVDRGASWTPVSLPQTSATGTCLLNQLLVSPSSATAPASIYYLAAQGALLSRDGGATWTSLLPGNDLRGMAADPANPSHFYAWTDANVSPPTLFETSDAWSTSTAVTDGLPAGQILAVALDPVNVGRAYLSMSPTLSDPQRTKLYLRTGAGASWQRLSVPPYPDSVQSSAPSIAVSPTLDLCQSGNGQSCAPCPPGQPVGQNEPQGTLCQTFPTVYAGTVISTDGGSSWQDFPILFEADTVLFDRTNPDIVYAASSGALYVSTDPAHKIWSSNSQFSAPVGASIVQDATLPQTFYSATGNALYTTSDSGQNWNQVSAPGLSLGGGLVRDLAPDPTDPNVAYALMTNGVFKTKDGGQSWSQMGTGPAGINNPGVYLGVSHIVVDPLNRNNIYAGRPDLWRSPDGGTSWIHTGITVDFGAPDTFALDPLVPDAVVGWSEPFLGPSTPQLYSQSSDPTYQNWAVHRSLNTDPGLYDAPTAYSLQVIPNAARSVLFSYDGLGRVSETENVLLGDTLIPSLAGGDQGTSFSVQTGLSYVIFDGSDGSYRLFANCGAGPFPVGDPTTLCTTTVNPDGSGFNGWEPLSQTSGFSDFTRLVIDSGSAGQGMYTLGGTGTTISGLTNTLWESHDGGVNWTQDAAPPAHHVNNVWVSPLDGSVYATVMQGNVSTSTRYMDLLSDADAGSLWKRTPRTDVPLDTPVVPGSLRASCTGSNPNMAISPGSTFPVGKTTISCTATDAFGVTGTQPITITVQDTTPPVISAPNVVLVPVPTVGLATQVTYSVTATDTVDPNPTLNCSPASGSKFNYGATTVLCTASDHATPTPNVSTASFSVIVSTNGNLPLPTISAPPSVTIEAVGPNGAPGNFQVSAASGSGQPLSVNCTPSLNSTFSIGVTNVSCSANDPSTGATVSAAFPVTVQDTTPPTITVTPPGDITMPAQGPWGAQVAFSATAVDQVDGTVPATCSPSGGNIFPLGATVVGCHATDQRGNQTTVHFNVNVVDLNPPVFNPPLADMVVDAQDSLGAMVTYAPTATDPEDGAASVSCLPKSPSWFQLYGPPTQVTCTATDLQGNQTVGTFAISVLDLSPPVVTVPSPITVEATGPNGAPVTFPTPVSAADLVDGPVAPTCMIGTSNPATVASGSTFPVGENLVTCVAGDKAGNVGKATFTVTVQDTTPPTLNLPGPISASADATGTAVVTYSPTPSASDLVSGAVPVVCQPITGSRFAAGATTVTCTARDAAGNQATGKFTVTVQTGSPNGHTCQAASECSSNFCVDGVCCASACGGGDPGDCQACSTKAGGTANGACTALAAATVCRPSAGSCDVAETCDGSSFACPADKLAPSTTVCRASAGVCDVAETCTGTSAACPADKLAPATTVCRASAGVCDVAETCTGTSAACPADVMAPATTVCRASAGACDVAETCNGTSAACPADKLVAPGTVCRTSAGTCDVAETCNGTSAACPADKLVASGTVCAPATNTCQTAGVCSGSAATCPGVTTKPGCKVDTTPPVWSKVPGTITAYATSTSGAKVTYTSPVATDAVDGVRPVTCTPASGSQFKVGKTTVTCTASDKSNNSTSVSFTMWVQYQAPTDGSFFLLPLLANGKAVFPISALPLPVVFRLTGASAGITNLVATFSATKISSSVTGTTTIAGTAGTTASTGTTFSYVPLLKIYDYLWKVSNQTQGTYQITVGLGDGVTHQLNVSLKALK